MQTRSKMLLAAAGLLAVLLVVYVAATRPGPTDQEKIAAQTEVLRAAAENHSASQAMSVVSADYHDSLVSNTDQLNLFLRRTMGQGGAVQVQFINPVVTIQGDTATSQGHLRAASVQGGAVLADQDITLHWRRESGHRMLVFPDSVWRLISADYTAPGFGD